MKTNLIKAIYLTFGLSSLALTGCSDSWLKPEPLSFYEPSVTLSTKEGLEAALTTCPTDRCVIIIWRITGLHWLRK